MKRMTFPVLGLCIVLIMGCLGGAKGPEPLNLAGFDGNKAGLANQFVSVANPEYVKGMKKVFIPSFQVEFVTRSGASAQSYRSKQYQSADVSVSYNLKGIDNGVFQSLTDTAYHDFMTFLEAKGVEVISLETLKGNPVYQKIASHGEGSPSEQTSRVEPKAGKSLIFAPKGMPVYFTLYDKKAGIGELFSQFGAAASADAPHNLEAQLIEELGATMARVRIVVGFADLTTHRSMSRAAVNGTMRFTIAAEQTEIAFYNQVDSWEGGFGDDKKKAYNLNTGKASLFMLQEPIISGEVIDKEIIETTSTAEKLAEGALNAISLLAGSGASMSREYDAVADEARYEGTAKKYFDVLGEMFEIRINEKI